MRHEQGARTILVLLAAILVIMSILLIVQQDETRRRTASTPIRLVDTRLQLGSRYEQSPLGTWIRYIYVVDDVTYPGLDFRRWLDVATYQPKVCFDPKHPADHLLVKGSIKCGIDGGT